MSQSKLRIAVGADHGAFEMKNEIVNHLRGKGHEVEDFGTDTAESVDYPDYANIVAHNVSDGTFDFGILACTSGVGMCIAANRFHHVRAANVRDVEETVTTRRHNNSNVLCLSGKYTGIGTAKEMADAFLATEFEGGRHARHELHRQRRVGGALAGRPGHRRHRHRPRGPLQPGALIASSLRLGSALL